MKMRYLALVLTLLQFTLTSEYSAQSSTDESCRLTMVIPNHFVQAGKEDGVAKYRSKKNRTSLTMIKDKKGAKDGIMSAQAAADLNYKGLVQKENITDLSVVNEKIGKTDFVIISWLEHGQKRGSNACMTAYNSDCDLIYTFEMNSASSSKKELDKVFRSFLKSCKTAETK